MVTKSEFELITYKDITWADYELLSDRRGNYRVSTSGADIWYLVYNKFHRLDGPAAINGDMSEEWYIYNEYHRIGGPAITFSSGKKEWHVYGIQYYTNEAYQAAANLTDEDMLAMVIMHGNVK